MLELGLHATSRQATAQSPAAAYAATLPREPMTAILGNPDRLAVLDQLDLLDARPEQTFDRLTKLAARLTGARVALVTILDANRQLYKSEVGLTGPFAAARQAPLSHSFCQHVVATNEPLLVTDARVHPLVCDNPAVRELNVLAYLGVPLTTSDGYTVGSLCIIENQPRAWTHADLDTVCDLAAMVMSEIELRAVNRRVEQQVAERTQELEAARIETLERLAVAAEFRDDATGRHTRRVGQLAALLAASFGLDTPDVQLIERAAPLHDVGKIGIPDRILLKPGKLTPDELQEMQRHTTIGARILSGSRVPVLQLAEAIAHTHHERWDGHGYPTGLAAEAIPLPGRIVAVADAFDALTHIRPYKPAWTIDAALAELARQRGKQFDPAVVGRFEALWSERSEQLRTIMAEGV